MKRKFIEPTENNIEEFKKVHFEKHFREIKEDNEKMHSLLNKRLLSDEEITERINTIFDTSLMKNHKTIVPGTEYDIYDYVCEIQDSPVENRLIILLDENKKPIDSKVTEIGTSTSVYDPEGWMHSTLRYLLGNMNAKYFIEVHNHPGCVKVGQSEADRIQTLKMMIVGNMIDIKLLDSCIISPFDFFSRVQDDEANNKPSIYHYDIDENAKEYMKKSDYLLYFIIRRAVEGE